LPITHLPMMAVVMAVVMAAVMAAATAAVMVAATAAVMVAAAVTMATVAGPGITQDRAVAMTIAVRANTLVPATPATPKTIKAAAIAMTANQPEGLALVALTERSVPARRSRDEGNISQCILFTARLWKIEVMEMFLRPVSLIVVFALGACTSIGESMKDSTTRNGPSRQTAKPQSAERYGAITFSDSTQIWRFRWNVVSQQRAIDLALQDCGQSDCRVLLSYGAARCGTFAMGRDGKTAAVARHTAKEAETAARAACNSISSACKVAPAQCNT